MSTKTGRQNTRQSFIKDRVETVTKERAVMQIHLAIEMDGGTGHSIHLMDLKELQMQLVGGCDTIVV